MRLDLRRLPFRFNWRRFPTFDAWPRGTDPRLVLNSDLPVEAFERSVSQFKVDTAWKMTSRNRHKIADERIDQIATPTTRILDVGASSGITSLDLIAKLGDRFSRFYVTDLYFSIPYARHAGAVYFYHPKTKRCVLRVTDRAITYQLDDGWPVLQGVAQRLIAGAPLYNGAMQEADLLHPSLRVVSDGRIAVEEYDVFQPWPHELVHIVKAANVLNREYFSHDQIRAAMKVLWRALEIGGVLFAIDNKDIEKVSIFCKTDSGFMLETNLNGGSGVVEAMQDAHNPTPATNGPGAYFEVIR